MCRGETGALSASPRSDGGGDAQRQLERLRRSLYFFIPGLPARR